MYVFDANPESDTYPDQLRDARQQMKMSQSLFSAAAGYSAVMQGRYETERSKPNSAMPSDRTAKAIKATIESFLAEQGASTQASPTAGHETKTLKSFSPLQIEQALSAALRSLLGSPCDVAIKDVVWGDDDGATVMKLVVSQA